MYSPGLFTSKWGSQWIWLVDLNPDMWGNGDVIFTACAQVVLVDEASMEMATTIADGLRAMGATSIMDGAQHAQRKARCWCGRDCVWGK